MRTANVQRIIEALEATPEAAASGIEIVDVELTGSGKAAAIRVYIDKPGGLVIDDIAAANGWIDAVIEKLDPIKGHYTLEVSSPGIDRPLRTLEHFARVVGDVAQIKTDPIGGRANWTGVLAGVDGDDVLLEVDGECVKLDFVRIKKAHIKGTVDFSKNKESR
jgi:ribosome maturation factor RimP